MSGAGGSAARAVPATAVPGTSPPDAQAAKRAPSPTTLRLLNDPIGPTILRLAAPNAIALTVQTSVSIAETWFVGALGTDSLAGFALVFPFVAMLQMLSAGAVGGGINAAVARALGAGDRARAEALALHATVIGIGMGIAVGLLMLLFGRTIFTALGGRGAALEQACIYANVVFLGAAAACLSNSLASVFRGSGNMIVPSLTLVGVAALQIPLSGALTLGWGPFPRLGIAGTGYAYVVAFAFGAVAQVVLLLRSRGTVRLLLRLDSLRAALFADILRVGALASLSPVQTVLTVILTTGIVGGFGTAAIAGYGIGARLELMQIPIIFGIGTALVATVGANIGAGQVERAKRAAWTGALAAAVIVGTIGAVVAVAPRLWLDLFTADPAVIAAGSAYLRTVGPCYFFFALGVALYFASQGAGHVLWPVVGGTVRLAVAAGGGWTLVHLWGGGVENAFLALSVAMALFGAVTAAAVALTSWAPRRRG